jgi:hypothetical protein
MNTTSIFISYAFLGISLICLFCFFYFKTLIIKTKPDSNSKDKIIGEMHNPEQWRTRNNNLSYVTLFWAILSAGIFIYLKYFYAQGVVSLAILFGYIGAIVISAFIFGKGKREKAH